ncbi:SWI/SNF-related matrix-associated actin-dependent regulator of chromatin subfamily A-like protein 1 [Culicoides brevitarsis]|uniref:SWI/SNF-related matrix-associated actin-dependent regulator of chromatin subfamily A-like protein 1 n=1 Tax=Culicoides brevitarsis TaxID=469753 RepID=UPI00307C5FBD
MYGSAEEIAKRRQEAIERQKLRKLAESNENTSQNNSSSIVGGLASNSFYANSKHDNKIRPNVAAQRLKKPYDVPSSSRNSKIAPVFQKPLTLTFTFVSEERFSVKMLGFSETVVNIFKTMPSKSYDPRTTNWTFNKSEYEALLSKINNNEQLKGSNLKLETIPNFVLRIFREKVETDHIRDMPLSEAIEPKLANALMSFQKEGFYFGVKRQGRVLIADEMGLGKTYQAIALADFYNNDWPLLVCTTAAMRETWASKIRELLPKVNPQRIICVTSGNDPELESARVVITSYSLMESLVSILMQKKFGVIIMDESHTVKNNKAKRTNVAEDLCKNAKRVILLSGTPALSRPKELFSQINMLAPGFASFKDYSTRYCAGHQTRFGWNADGSTNLEELNLLLKKKFMIRRTKDDCLNDLKEKNRESVILDASLIKSEDKAITEIAGKFQNSKGRDREELLIQYYSKTAEIKTRAVCAYLKNLLKEPMLKFIVFAHHKVMLDAIADFIYQQGVSAIKIDGTTRHDIRDKNVHKFQNDKKCRVAILSLIACSAGITLTAAKMVVFAELTWTPSILEQAESRAHRIGQTEDVTVKYLLAKGTADDVIWPMLQKKQKSLNKAGLNNEDFTDNTCINAPNSAGDITLYLKETKISEEANTSSNKTTNVIAVNEIDWGDDFDNELLSKEANIKSDEAEKKSNIATAKEIDWGDDFDNELLTLPLK